MLRDEEKEELMIGDCKGIIRNRGEFKRGTCMGIGDVRCLWLEI